MRVLLIHNFYSSATPSGENQVVSAEIELLKSRGIDIEVLSRNSDDIHRAGISGVARAAFGTPWNVFAAAEVRARAKQFKPDVVHVHNTFPSISPSIFHALRTVPTARVLTLHNYRIFCPAGVPLRQGVVCTDCLDRQSVVPAVVHGCYRGSRAATLPLALNVALHRHLGTWQRQVEAFIVFSEFQSSRMIGAGLRPEKVHIKPNFFGGRPVVQPWADRQPFVIYVGRLSSEKGTEALIRAWRLWSRTEQSLPELRLVGDGPLRSKLAEMATGLPVRFLGLLNKAETLAQIASAKLLILPSECFEGFPMVLGEAFAHGTPAAVSDIGPLPTIVQSQKNGVVFRPGDPVSLFNVVRDAWNSDGLLEQLGRYADSVYSEKYTAEVSYLSLLSIYQKAIRERGVSS